MIGAPHFAMQRGLLHRGTKAKARPQETLRRDPQKLGKILYLARYSLPQSIPCSVASCGSWRVAVSTKTTSRLEPRWLDLSLIHI